MSDNISKHLDNPTPNGSEDERDPPQDGNEGEDEASEGPPACLDSARCQLCHSEIRRLQEHAVERKKVYQTALQRRKDALTTKDAAFKALKTQLYLSLWKNSTNIFMSNYPILLSSISIFNAVKILKPHIANECHIPQ